MVHSLKARYVFPVAGKPIADGVVTFDQERIISVGPSTNGPEPDNIAPDDLGNVAIIPGLVNAHTHLEFSHLEKPVGSRGMDLGEWIDTLTSTLRQQGHPPHDASRRGLEESAAAGITTLGEIAQPGWPTDDFQAAPIDATIFLELIAPTDDDVDEKLKLAHQHIASAPVGKNTVGKAAWRPGISPHAPYSVHPRLFTEAVAISARHKIPLAFHLAESPEELEFLKTAGGPFCELLKKLGKWDAAAHRSDRRPLDFLRIMAPAHRSLIVHGNYLSGEEIAFIAHHAGRMSVVYCPRTHHYFNHPPYPLEKLLAAGVNVALGTDSRASSPDLSLLSDIRHVAHSHPAIAPATVLRMGTLNGAKALAREREVGTLEVGKQPNLAIVPLPEGQASDPHNLLFDQNAPVRSSRFHGQKIFA